MPGPCQHAYLDTRLDLHFWNDRHLLSHSRNQVPLVFAWLHWPPCCWNQVLFELVLVHCTWTLDCYVAVTIIDLLSIKQLMASGSGEGSGKMAFSFPSLCLVLLAFFQNVVCAVFPEKNAILNQLRQNGACVSSRQATCTLMSTNLCSVRH